MISKEKLEKIFETAPFDDDIKYDNDIEHAISLGISGLLTDGGHHKQWVIEEMLKLLGVDLKMLKEVMGSEDEKNGYDWEDGIAP